MDITTHDTVRLLQSLVDTVHEPLVVLDDQLRILTASTAFFDWFGLTRELTLYQPLTAVFKRLEANVPELQHRLETLLNGAATTEENFQMSCVTGRHGRCICFMNVRYLEPADSTPLLIMAIKARPDRRSEPATPSHTKSRFSGDFAATGIDRQQDRRIRERLLYALEIFTEGFAYFDADDRLVSFNQKYHETTGMGEALAIGIGFIEILTWNLRLNRIEQAVGREQEWLTSRLANFYNPAGPFDQKRSDGRWLRILEQRLPDGGLFMVIIDITGPKQTEKALLQAKQEAERAYAMKSSFLMTASHDLRQPLQSMRILKHLLEMKSEGSGPACAETGELFDEWENTLTVMERLIGGYLDISKLESGMVQPDWSDFPIAELLDQIYSEFAPQAADKQLELRLVNCSAWVRSDRLLLGQILGNFISNAINYTDSGKVLIGCRRRAGHLSLQAWDTGRGIAGDQRERIFEEFYQLDNGARNQSQGYGLGLTIARLAAKLLEHPIRVDSIPGRGSLFALTVPYANNKDVPAPPPALIEVPEPRSTVAIERILVIDDEIMIRRSLKLLLQNKGLQVQTAETGEQALTLLKHRDFQPQLIITDLWLPGTETELAWLKKLRNHIGPELPVIVISGDTSPGLHNAVEALHCISITKPIRANHLLRMIDQFSESPATRNTQ